jgi:hypothetical protein
MERKGLSYVVITFSFVRCRGGRASRSKHVRQESSIAAFRGVLIRKNFLRRWRMSDNRWGRMTSAIVTCFLLLIMSSTDGLLMGRLAVSSAEASVTLEVLNPRGEFTPPPIVAPTSRVADLAGKKIGIYWNEKAGADNYLDVIEELLKEKFPTAKVLRYRGAFDLGEATAAKVAKECDVLIYGVSDTTSCAWAGAVGSARLEKSGRPVVFVVTDKVADDAKSSAEDIGMPGLLLVTVPGDSYYKQRISREEVRPIAVGTFGAITDALTRPLTAAETSTKPKQVETPRTIKVAGESYEDALEKFNQLFVDNHWGSGLPLLPPTPERVKWMLSGTSRSHKEVIGTVAPRNGIATIEKIAINAVMAGAKPEYLPVIIAAMESLRGQIFILDCCPHSRGEHTEEGTAERAGEGSKAERALHEARDQD